MLGAVAMMYRVKTAVQYLTACITLEAAQSKWYAGRLSGKIPLRTVHVEVQADVAGNRPQIKVAFMKFMFNFIGSIGALWLAAACQPIAIQSPTMAPVATCDRNSGGADFVSAKVSKLSANFNPQLLQTPSPTDMLGKVTPADPYWNDLVAAFNAATPTLKDKLCSLDAIFIVQNTCPATGCTVSDILGNSWGLRQPASPPKRYIATSATLWQGGAALPFVDYENLRLQAVMQALDPTNGANWFKLPDLRPKFKSASPNTSAMTVLAALAHEYGHVLWYDEFVVNSDGSPDPGGPVYIRSSSALFCGGGFYTKNSWGTGNSGVNVPSPRWIAFGQRLSTQIHNPDLSGSLYAHLHQGNFGNAGAGSDLLKILANTDLVGTLASFTAIEDFVETYEWFQLISANQPLIDLEFQIDSLPPRRNIVQSIANKPGVQRKMACFSR